MSSANKKYLFFRINPFILNILVNIMVCAAKQIEKSVSKITIKLAAIWYVVLLYKRTVPPIQLVSLDFKSKSNTSLSPVKQIFPIVKMKSYMPAIILAVAFAAYVYAAPPGIFSSFFFLRKDKDECSFYIEYCVC